MATTYVDALQWGVSGERHASPSTRLFHCSSAQLLLINKRIADEGAAVLAKAHAANKTLTEVCCTRVGVLTQVQLLRTRVRRLNNCGDSVESAAVLSMLSQCDSMME